MTSSTADNHARPLPAVLNWFLPNLSAWLWLILFLFLVADPQRTRLVSGDGDANMHWRVGEHMIETHQIIRADVFSYTMRGAPILTKEWLAEILFALAGRLGGLTGLAVLAALVIATTFALLHRQLVREGNDLLVATVLVLIAAWASVPHWHARPHVFSMLLLLLWHGALRRFERSGEAMRLAATLAFLTLLWVNLHGGYLAGFMVLGAYWLAACIQRRRPESRGKLAALTWIGALCGAVSLLNPNGYHIHIHNAQFVRSSFFVNWLDEYASINFHLADSYGFLVWLAVLFLVIAVCRPRWSVGGWIVVISWSYFALYAVRNVSFFVLLTAPLLAEAVRSERWKRLSGRIAKIDSAHRGWVTVVLVAALVVTISRPVTSMPTRTWPVAAIAFVRAHPDRFDGNLFNLYGWGSYLLQALPEHKVFVDGRADFYGESFVREYDEVDELRPRWREVLAKYDVGWTLLPVSHCLNQALALESDWQVAYKDEVAMIYCKTK